MDHPADHPEAPPVPPRRTPPRTVLLLNTGGGMAGSTQSVVSLGAYLVKRGHRVLVGCPAGSFHAELAAAHDLPLPPLDFTNARTLAADVEALVHREGVDVVNAQATTDRRAAALLRWRGRLPAAFVVTRRQMPLTFPLEVFTIGATADRTIAVSDAVRRALVRRLHPAGRLVVVHNGLDLARVDAPLTAADRTFAQEAVTPADGRPVITVVARRKDQFVLLRALRQLTRPVCVVFAGITAEGLERDVAAVPDRHRVVFLGRVRRPLALYAHATLTALPSRIEGLSQTLLESMALGVPAIGSDAGGNAELLRDGETGWLAPPLDTAQWARRLDAILADEPTRRRVADAARAMVRGAFTLDHTAARTEAVYEAVLAGRPAGGWPAAAGGSPSGDAPSAGGTAPRSAASR